MAAKQGARLGSSVVEKEVHSQQYYEGLDINMGDLDKMEERIAALENYIGIDEGHDTDFFVKNDIEKLDAKCNRLDDFVKVIEDKNFLLNELFEKYDKLESFMKNGNPFTSQCLDLSKKSEFVIESADSLNAFADKLKEMQELERNLDF